MAPVSATLGSVALFAGTLLSVSCTSNPYFIGSVGAGGSDSTLNFALDLDHTGVSELHHELELTARSLAPSLSLRGESASATDWPSEQGARLLKGTASPQIQQPTPFTDATRALGFSSSAATYVASGNEGELAGDDFALELVLRAVPGAALLAKRASSPGWSLEVTPNGSLALTLEDAQRSLQVVSEPLVTRAWYHCLFWVSRSAGGRADCNGRSGEPSDLSALGNLSSAAKLSVGGGTPLSSASSELAYFAAFRSTPGGLGAAASWASVSRQRFAALTGVSPRVARGNPAFEPGLRDAPAYLDLQREGDAVRRLFLVGPDWPRIACRNDDNGARLCGYLSEPQRTRWLAPEASAWAATALSVLENHAELADGEQRMAGLVASSALVGHTLSWSGSYGGARQALSFFARAEAGQFVGVSAGALGATIFDVRAGSVISGPADVRATIEPWGDGLFRCAYTFTPETGPLNYQVELLGSADAQPFAGDDQRAWLDIAVLQLDVGQAYPGSPLAAPSQPRDQLSFSADDGNLPTASAVSEHLSVLLPAGPRLTDQALLNLNRGGSFETQVQLYIRGDTGQLKFLGLNQSDTHWAFDHTVSLLDGLRHRVDANWGPTLETLSVDGVLVQRTAQIANDPPFALDRMDLGFSDNSSGSLEGLLGGLEIGPFSQP